MDGATSQEKEAATEVLARYRAQVGLSYRKFSSEVNQSLPENQKYHFTSFQKWEAGINPFPFGLAFYLANMETGWLRDMGEELVVAIAQEE